MGVVRCQRCGKFIDLDYNVEDGVVLPNGIDWSCFNCCEANNEVCLECGEPKPEDDRVKAGMKCGPCAYGNEPTSESESNND